MKKSNRKKNSFASGEEYDTFRTRALTLDFSVLQPKPDNLLTILEGLSALQFNTLLIRWAGTFPWRLDTRLCNDCSFPEEVIDRFGKKAADYGIELIPFLPLISDVTHIFGLPGYQMLNPQNGNTEFNTTSLVPLLEDILDDVVSLLPDVHRFFIRDTRGTFFDEFHAPETDTVNRTLKENDFGLVTEMQSEVVKPESGEYTVVPISFFDQAGRHCRKFWGKISLQPYRTYPRRKEELRSFFSRNINAFKSGDADGVLIDTLPPEESHSVDIRPLELLWSMITVGAEYITGNDLTDTTGPSRAFSDRDETADRFYAFLEDSKEAWCLVRTIKEKLFGMTGDGIMRMEQRHLVRSLYGVLDRKRLSLQELSEELDQAFESAYEPKSRETWLQMTVAPIEEAYYSLLSTIKRL